MKKKILIFTTFYEPGYKSGGPVRSITMLVKNLSKYYNFFIVTTNRDYGDTENYAGIQSNKWFKKGLNALCYINASLLDLLFIPVNIIMTRRYDCIYLNNFYSLHFSIIPLLCYYYFKRTKKEVILIAPRGQFAPDALKIKPARKKIMLFLLKLTALKMKNIVFQATCNEEIFQIESVISKRNCKIFMAPNFGSFKTGINLKQFPYKQKNKLAIVYIGRVSALKNIDFSLEVLKCVDFAEIRFDIYGPCYEEEYLHKLESKIALLPSNVNVNFIGELPHSKVPETLMKYDLFFSPSKSENYGHSMMEALSHGIPLLIGKNTPWKDLYNNSAGWDLPTEDISQFVYAIKLMTELDNDGFLEFHKGALSYIQNHDLFCSVLDLNRKMFQEILE